MSSKEEFEERSTPCPKFNSLFDACEKKGIDLRITLIGSMDKAFLRLEAHKPNDKKKDDTPIGSEVVGAKEWLDKAADRLMRRMKKEKLI